MTRNNLEKQMLRTKKLAEEKGISEDELEKMGVQEGDIIRILDYEFEYRN